MSLAGIIAVIAVACALGALVWCALLSRKLADLRSARGRLVRLAAEGDLKGFAETAEERLGRLERAVDHLRLDDEALAARLAQAVRHVGLERYDAFGDAAGEQSFSLALLDDARSGLVMTSIYGRGEYRVYAKPIDEGRSDYRLTAEEESAVTSAMSGTLAGGGE